MGKYSARFKFKVALAALPESTTYKEVAETYGVHPNTVGSWKNKLLDEGHKIYLQDTDEADCEREKAALYQLIGMQQVEIAHLKRLRR